MKKILLIGCGHMGDALAASWIRSKKYSITIVDPLKYIFLKKKYKSKVIRVFKNISNLDNFTEFDFVIFAVKPKDLQNLMLELSKIKFDSKIALVSVVAGKKIKNFEQEFKYLKNYFRVMPNMPAFIGQGMNCIVSNKKASKISKKEVVELFSYSGITEFFKDENEIDMATAISGSGPGFVFNIIDAMENAAIDLGFDRKIANILVTQTFKGSIDLLLKNKLTARELVNMVATKGGTTEAGLKIMKKNKLHKIFKDLTKSSYRKAKQQGK